MVCLSLKLYSNSLNRYNLWNNRLYFIIFISRNRFIRLSSYAWFWAPLARVKLVSWIAGQLWKALMRWIVTVMASAVRLPIICVCLSLSFQSLRLSASLLPSSLRCRSVAFSARSPSPSASSPTHFIQLFTRLWGERETSQIWLTRPGRKEQPTDSLMTRHTVMSKASSHSAAGASAIISVSFPTVSRTCSYILNRLISCKRQLYLMGFLKKKHWISPYGL